MSPSTLHELLGTTRTDRVSRVALVEEPYAAFTVRLALIDAAVESIDAQYYIWERDLSGRLLAQRLFAAADRGVQVRVLLDDVDFAQGGVPWLALDAHPRIAVRVFNAFRRRPGDGLRRLLEGLLDFRRLNHRMHNKSLTVDGSATVIGGRNIGNAYFGLDSKSNFRDLDVLAVGPVAGEVRTSFDAFWNSHHAQALPELARVRYTPLRLFKPRKRLARFARRALIELHGSEWNAAAVRERLGQCAIGLLAAKVQVLTDTPGKLAGEPSPIADAFFAFTSHAKHELLIESAYFVPGARGCAVLGALATRGIRVRITTNSLASTDVPVVHGGYAAARRPLLLAGAQLFEVKPLFPIGLRRLLRRPRSRASVHTKAATVDGRLAFVGSMNFDPRSARINTEMGLLIESAQFAAQVAQALDRTAAPKIAWQVEIDHNSGRMQWRSSADGKDQVLYREPWAGWTRRLLAWLARVLPVQHWL